ncbi:MAG: SufE family protein [Halobacteriovoraceae bacterium]|jgi:cysteine desulfuration protein SufE|nr:SufE family protein [Halobacteriovoraceae bacterium]
MSLKERSEELITRFNKFSDWEDKYKELIKIGRELDDFPLADQVDKYLISGCQSSVWLKPTYQNGQVLFQATSDAMLVRGIIAVLVFVYSKNTPDEILEFKSDFLQEIGITHHLSLNRTNGLASMFKQIQLYALAYKSLSDQGVLSL